MHGDNVKHAQCKAHKRVRKFIDTIRQVAPVRVNLHTYTRTCKPTHAMIH